jgi:hypothetical protein
MFKCVAVVIAVTGLLVSANSEVFKCINVWSKEMLKTLPIRSTRAVVLHSDFNSHLFSPFHYRVEVISANRPDEAGTLGGEQYRGLVTVLGDGDFPAIHENFPFAHIIRTWNCPEIFHLNSKGDRIGLGILSLDDVLYIWGTVTRYDGIYSNIWPIREFKLSLSSLGDLSSKTTLPECDKGISEYQESSDLRPTKLFLVVGICLNLLSLTLIFKVIDKINLDPSCNDNLCVAGFFLALGLFLAGGWLILVALGLAPLELIGHRL